VTTGCEKERSDWNIVITCRTNVTTVPSSSKINAMRLKTR
jgi:chitodextrinase